jgi:hypothetical protein
MFDKFNRGEDTPGEKEFLHKILELVGKNKDVDNGGIGESELTIDISIILQDIFNARVRLVNEKTISLIFKNGEEFNVFIEKSNKK